MASADDLLRAAASGPEGLDSFFAAHPEDLTPARANEVRDIFKGALGRGEYDLAQFAAMTAARVQLQLGDRYEGLVNFIDAQQAAFGRAETAAAYDEVRNEARHAIELADEISAADLAFRGAVLAADCAYFAAQAQSAVTDSEQLFAALRDVLAAAERANAVDDSDVWFERFVSLIEATASDAMSRYFGADEQQTADDLLRRLAAVADERVPADFVFRSNPGRTSKIADVLTQLSEEYGS